MGFLQKDRQKEDGTTNAATANYLSASANVNSPLRQLAAAKGKRYGAAVSSEFLLQEKGYADLIALRECSIVTPNGELKWNATEPQPGKFTFDSADAILFLPKA